jgi:choice-of-anchor A domain-containing protein
MKKTLAVFVVGAFFGCSVGHATSAPFCAVATNACPVSAFTIVAMGYGSTAGNIIGPGSADVTGRVAAAGQITNAFTIGAEFQSGSNSTNDPWGSYANGYAMYAAGGISVPSGSHFQINGGGNAYAPGASNSNFYFNDQGKLVNTTLTGSSALINFSSLSSEMLKESSYLAGLTANGIIESGSKVGGNPSWLVLDGTNTTLDVFNLTAAQFDGGGGSQLDFVVPTTATVIVNVAGTSLTLNSGSPILVNGQQESDTNNDNDMILFNFSQAATVNLDAQFDAAMLAPMATLTSTANSQIGGTLIVAAVGATGEVHNNEFQGKLPTPPVVYTPEPGTLALMGTGILGLAGLIRRKRRL